MAMPSSSQCLLAYLHDHAPCKGEILQRAAGELADILEHAARQKSGARPPRGGVCTGHYNMFCNLNWQDSKATPKVAKKAVCAGCFGKKNKRLRRRKTVFMQTWNNEHPFKPLPSGSVMCGECVALTVVPESNVPGTGGFEGPPPSKRLKTGPTIEDGYDSDAGSDSGSLPDGGPILEPVDDERDGDADSITIEPAEASEPEEAGGEATDHG
jgi:hypothetical protein